MKMEMCPNPVNRTLFAQIDGLVIELTYTANSPVYNVEAWEGSKDSGCGDFVGYSLQCDGSTWQIFEFENLDTTEIGASADSFTCDPLEITFEDVDHQTLCLGIKDIVVME